MIRFLKSHSIITSIIYIIPIVQIYSGIGLFYNGFLIGLFPAAILYFFWLFLLSKKLGHQGSKKRNVQVKLFFSTFIIHPSHWLLLNLKMSDEHLGVIVDPIGGIIFFWLLYVVIDAWLFISKSMHCLISGMKFQYVFFSDYRKFTLFFLGGLLTIWWLQPAIVKAIALREKEPSPNWRKSSECVWACARLVPLYSNSYQLSA